MRVELMFPSKYLCGADLIEHGDVTLAIAEVFMDDLQTRDGGKERKPVIRFERAKKMLVLNKTNAMQIAELYGPETNGWAGKRITLHAARVSAFGKMVDAVRVRPTKPKGRPVQKPPAAHRNAEPPPASTDEPPEDYPLPGDDYPEAEAS